MSPAGRPCSRLDRARSEFVDGSIGHDARESLLRHLGECRNCRDDVAELRRLRDLLTTERSGPATPSAGLQGRLVSIAAEAADEPLWTPSFRPRDRAVGRMPSRRRRRRRLTAVATVLGSVLAAAAGVGYAAAPRAVGAIDDPTESAQAGFATVRTGVPLSSDPATAAMVAAARAGPSTEASLWSAATTPAAPETAPTGRAIGSGAAAAALARGEQAADTVGFQGAEEVVVQDGSRRLTAEVSLAASPGQGTELAVRSDAGTMIATGSMPVTGTGDRSLVALLADGYTLSGTADVAVLGRRATVVEARPTDPSRPTARWWIDQQTGLLLGRQTLQPSGALIQSSMLTRLSLDPRTGPTALTGPTGPTVPTGLTGPTAPQLSAPQLTAPIAAAVLAPSASTGLAAAGWTCGSDLSGLALTEVRTDDPATPGLVHLVYTDGVTTMSVIERRGRLARPPAGAVRDRSLNAYLTGGAPLSASWQSGDRVITVVTDGSRDQLAQAVHSLPHARIQATTTMGRVRAGWAQLISMLFR